MKKDIEFQEVGKETPYRVPEGFFDRISEKTLQNARQREQNRKKNLILVRTFAVAASMVAVAFIGYLKFGSESPEIKLTTNMEQPEPKPPIAPSPEMTKQVPVAEISKPIPEKTITGSKENEGMTDVLADMTDDELLQLVAMYRSDPFISEASINQ